MPTIYRTRTVAITDEAFKQLQELARDDFRGPREEAAFLLTEAIRRRIAAKARAAKSSPKD